MGSPNKFIWHEIFEFPSEDGKTESVVWRVLCLDDESVHEVGKRREARKLREGNNILYIGFVTSAVGPIRRRTTRRGHGFIVYHCPSIEEGAWHSVIKIVIANGIDKLSKNDNSDVRAIMQELFEANYTVFKMAS
jgi:hypothetical protein